MQLIFSFLSTCIGLYSLLIFFRIILTWVSGAQYGKPLQLLARITDPYLDWWRQKINLRAGFLDLSPIAGIVALSVAQTICASIAQRGRISLGIILVVCLSAVWSAASFIIGLCIVVLIFRLIAYFINANMFSTFWRVIDSISRPLLYRVNRLIFGKRIVNFMTGIITAIAIMGAIWFIGRFIIRLIIDILLRSSL
jgi:YggT family protein